MFFKTIQLLSICLILFCVAGCGKPKNTVIDPGDTVMSPEEMEAYNQESASGGADR
ncbi:hypothetical protein CA13_41980 [Planctomycetes bacterium CA13]|uniref:Secreted protein n=1 Tax=Novipirellula herctigrandis TaxID=2527986 RepID=A0A5C5Z697_9BACT|nr:hypothetical protein CA13_41980 [Planctomycetes bacterium CA13]